MGVITVEGLGQVEISGDTPTPDEARRIRRAMDALQSRPTPEPAPTQTEFTPEQIESAGFGDLAQTMRGFQQLEEPPGLLEGMARSAAAEVVGVPAGLASTLEAGMDATGVGLLEAVTGMKVAPSLDRALMASTSKLLSETEREVRGTPSLKGDGLDAWESFLGGVAEGDTRKLSEGAAWMAESGAAVVPQVITAVASLPLSILTRVGDHAKARAAYRGDDDITVTDIGLGLGAAGFGSIADRFLGGIGRGAGSRAADIGRGLAVEGASGAGESVLEQVGTREGEGLFLGVDPATVGRAALTEATAAGLPAAGLSLARSRRPEDGDLATPVATPAVTTPAVATVPEGLGVETEVAVVPPILQDYLQSLRVTPREQVEADTDVAVRRVEADRALAEEVAAVPTRPRTGEVEPRTTQAQVQAALDQADVDVDTAASDPSASLADVVEKQALTAGLRFDANNASNEDTRAFLQEIHPDDPGRVRQIMSQERVPVSQALAELQARDLHTRTPDDLTVETTAPFKAMIDDIIATGRGADHVEKLAFGHAKVQHQRVYRNLLREYDKAETPQARKDLSEKVDRVRKSSDEIALANAKAQRAWGLSGKYSQLFLDKDLNVSEAIAKAKVDSGRSELEPAQRKFIEDEFVASDRLEARAKPKRQAAIKKMRALSRVIRRLESKAAPTGRDSKLLSEAKKRYDKAEGIVVAAEADIRAAKSIRIQAAKKSLMHPAFRGFSDITDVSRSLRSSGEDSSLGRQGMSLVFRQMLDFDTQWLKTIPPALKILGAGITNNPAGRARARRMQQELVNQPYQAAYDLAGGELADVEGLGGAHGGTMDSKQEEFAANLFNRMEGFDIPFVGRVEPGRRLGSQIVEPSQNAYALTLNLLRRHYFDQALTRRLKYEGIPTDLSAKELVSALKGNEQLLDDIKADAYLGNVFTGRGNFKLANPTGDDFASMAARGLLYAPKYTASLIESALYTVPSAVLTAALTRRSYTKPFNRKNYPEWFKKLKNREYDPRVEPLRMAGFGPFKDVSDYQRGRLLTESVKEVAWLMSLMTTGLLLAGDESDEDVVQKLARFLDPGSPDFGKIVKDNWHIGLDSRTATLRHILPYGVTPDEAGEYLTVDPARVDVLTRLGRLARNKLTPFVQGAIGTGTNEDYLGNQVTDQTYEEAKDTVDGLLKHLGQRSIPMALSFTPIIAESLGKALGEGMGETGIPGLVPPDPAMTNPDAPSLLNKMLITGGANMFGIGVQYYDPESGDANLPPELRKLLRSADPARALRPPSLP